MTQADWVKAIESLRTSPTGAINVVFYKNGKRVGRVGVNKIEDLKEDLINLFKYEITLAQQRTEKKWREKIRVALTTPIELKPGTSHQKQLNYDALFDLLK